MRYYTTEELEALDLPVPTLGELVAMRDSYWRSYQRLTDAPSIDHETIQKVVDRIDWADDRIGERMGPSDDGSV